MSLRAFLIFALFLLLLLFLPVVVFLFAVPAAAAELLTTPGQKSAYVARLQTQLQTVSRTRQEYRTRLTAAEARMQALRQRLTTLRQGMETRASSRDRRSNEKAVDLTKELMCSARIHVPGGIKAFGWDKGWDQIASWIGKVAHQLGQDPVENAYLWYGRYDFNATADLFDRFQQTITAGRARYFEQLCRDLEPLIFGPVRTRARTLDEINREIDGMRPRGEALRAEFEAARRRSDKDAMKRATEKVKPPIARMRQLKPKAQTLKSWINDTMGRLQASIKARSADMRHEMQRLMSRLGALRVPKRGKIYLRQTEPSRLSVRPNASFGITLHGKGIPTGLGAGQIGTPPGMNLQAVSGGGRRLYLYFRTTGRIADGRYQLDIAGEKVPFSFANARPGDPAPRQPLVSRPGPAAQPANVAARIPDDGRGTDLTPTTLGEHPQELLGYWRYPKDKIESSREEDTIFRIGRSRDKSAMLLMGRFAAPTKLPGLKPGQRILSADGTGVIGQYDQGSGGCFTGLRLTKEVNPDQCKQYLWWEASQICFTGPDYLKASEHVASRKHDREKCEVEGDPSDLPITYDRFDGVSFSPVAAGKFIHIVAVAAPAQYQASVKLTWDYALLGAKRMEMTVRRRTPDGAVIHQQASSPPDKPGEYVFTTGQSGVYYFVFRIFDVFGKMVHRDVMRAIIPGIPGLGG